MFTRYVKYLEMDDAVELHWRQSSMWQIFQSICLYYFSLSINLYTSLLVIEKSSLSFADMTFIAYIFGREQTLLTKLLLTVICRLVFYWTNQKTLPTIISLISLFTFAEKIFHRMDKIIRHELVQEKKFVASNSTTPRMKNYYIC